MNFGPFSSGDRKALALLSLLLAAGLFFNIYSRNRLPLSPAVLLASMAVPAGPSGPAASVKPAAALGRPLDINRASVDELEMLPGVGPALALRIAAYRQKAGGFRNVEELLKVPGIGPKKLAQIGPKVEIGRPAVSSAEPAGK